jgi:integrase
VPRRATFKERKDERGRWYIDVPKSMTANGKRQRYFFPNRDTAREKGKLLGEKYSEHGSNAAAISPTLASDATKAAEILEPYDVSLVTAARFFATARQRDAASETLTDAVAAYLKSSVTLRDRTYKSYENTLKRLVTAHGDRMLSTLTATEIVEAAGLDVHGAGAALHWRNLKAFWNWCAKSPRGWCIKELFDAVESPKTASDRDVSILSPAEAMSLLRTAQKHYPAAVASFALSLFAGIRAEELRRLTADDVTTDGIELSSKITKRGRRRHISLSPTLAAWLKIYPFEPVPNWNQVSAAVRRLAGWKVDSRLLEQPPTATRGAWPQNVMRHSHASYAIASGARLETLLFEFGHTGSPSVLRAHYVGKASKKAALEFFAIRPKGIAKKVPLSVVKRQTEGAA